MFQKFLNSLKTPSNAALIETIQKGYNNIFEEHRHLYNINSNKFLYHATYKPKLKSINEHGLGGAPKIKRNWSDSKKGVVYLAYDPNIAESYAESSDNVPEHYLDQIVILKIDTNQLDKDKLRMDENVIDGKDTLEYHGVIPPSAIQIC